MKNESGRSMIEIIGVMALMGLITAAAFILIKSTNASQKRTVVVDDVAKIVTGVRTLYADYDNLCTMTDSSVLAAMGVDSNGPYNGSTYSVIRAKYTGEDKWEEWEGECKSNAPCTYFMVKIEGLPKDECTLLGTRAWSQSKQVTSDCDSDKNNYVSIVYTK